MNGTGTNNRIDLFEDREPFAMAGIYSRGKTQGDPFTFAILATEANDLMRPIHDRMPVMLSAWPRENCMIFHNNENYDPAR